jgi:hypothetical protein
MAASWEAALALDGNTNSISNVVPIELSEPTLVAIPSGHVSPQSSADGASQPEEAATPAKRMFSIDLALAAAAVVGAAIVIASVLVRRGKSQGLPK